MNIPFICEYFFVNIPFNIPFISEYSFHLHFNITSFLSEGKFGSARIRCRTMRGRPFQSKEGKPSATTSSWSEKIRALTKSCFGKDRRKPFSARGEKQIRFLTDSLLFCETCVRRRIINHFAANSHRFPRPWNTRCVVTCAFKGEPRLL